MSHHYSGPKSDFLAALMKKWGQQPEFSSDSKTENNNDN